MAKKAGVFRVVTQDRGASQGTFSSYLVTAEDAAGAISKARPMLMKTSDIHEMPTAVEFIGWLDR